MVNNDCFVPRDRDVHLSLVVVVKNIDADTLAYHSLGGGFVYKIERTLFDRQFRSLSPEELASMMQSFQAVQVSIGENEGHIPGVSKGETWNGWACPYLSADTIHAAMSPGGYLHSQGMGDLVRFHYIAQTNDMLEIEEDGDGLSVLTSADINSITEAALKKATSAFDFVTEGGRSVLVGRCEKVEVVLPGDTLPTTHYRVGDGWCWEEDKVPSQAFTSKRAFTL